MNVLLLSGKGYSKQNNRTPVEQEPILTFEQDWNTEYSHIDASLSCTVIMIYNKVSSLQAIALCIQ